MKEAVQEGELVAARSIGMIKEFACPISVCCLCGWASHALYSLSDPYLIGRAKLEIRKIKNTHVGIFSKKAFCCHSANVFVTERLALSITTTTLHAHHDN